MAEVILADGSVALVDDDDFERVNRFRWRLHPQGYAFRKTTRGRGKHVTVLMHRFVMNAPDGMEVDHLHGNKLDNRKSELALITPLDHRRKHVHALVAYQKARQVYPDRKPCVVCGTIFAVNPRKRKRHKCCSAGCAQVVRVAGRKRQAALAGQPSSPSWQPCSSAPTSTP